MNFSSDSAKLGFWSVLLLGLNSMIGSGIFLIPSELIRISGIYSLGVIVATAMLAGCIGLCFAEASGRFNRSGGTYLYARAAFGPFVGFQVGFLKWVSGWLGWASSAVGFSLVCQSIFPTLASPFYEKLIIVGLIALLTGMNLLGVQASKYINNSITIAKLIPLIAFVCIGIFCVNTRNIEALNLKYTFSINSFSKAITLAFYTFSGFEVIAVAANEIRNPATYAPRAIIACFGIITILYLSIQWILMGILGTHIFEATNPIAETFGALVGKGGSELVLLGTFFAVLGTNIAAAFTVPQPAMVLAEDHLLFPVLAYKSSRNVPYVAIISTGIITALIALSGSFMMLVTISVVARFTQFLPTCLAVIKLRKLSPNTPSTFIIPGGSLIPIFASVVSVYIVSQNDWHHLAIGFCSFLVSTPLYFIMKRLYASKYVSTIQP